MNDILIKILAPLREFKPKLLKVVFHENSPEYVEINFVYYLPGGEDKVIDGFRKIVFPLEVKTVIEMPLEDYRKIDNEFVNEKLGYKAMLSLDHPTKRYK